MSSNSLLLQSEGWNASIDGRLLRFTDRWEEAPEFRSHGHVLRRLFTDVKVDAVFCVDGRPSVCIKDGRSLSTNQIEELRHQLWNLGATTLLIVEGQNDIKVFSSYMKPSKSHTNGFHACLTEETIDSLKVIDVAMSVRELVQRIETGAIYRDYKPLFEREGSVDHDLLSNLQDVRDLICPEKTKEGYQQTHAFIGRFLFSCYLLDRQIIGAAYLKKAKLPEADDMLGFLTQASQDNSRVLVSLFASLHRDFNGSLFGSDIEPSKVGATEISYLLRFLSGENLRTGQPSLFKLYDFRFIPVELISSIYEEFLRAEAALEERVELAATAHAHSQRRHGAYYTPARLAELTVDIATEGWTTLLDKRCLDPACGSGVFLVILFIRMAEEWRKRNPTANTRERYEQLLQILSNNIEGVDIHPTACLVTCFSLYLAFLDQMEPKEVIELKEVLERDSREKLLPRILWTNPKQLPKLPHLSTVRQIDFFHLSVARKYSLVIGNPPWVSRKPATSAENWLFLDRTNPYLSGIVRKKRETTFFPTKELACAFMWKAGLHTDSFGRICQVLPSRVLLSNNTDAFQSAWIQRHKLGAVWLLADWRHVLFPSADCPSIIVRYQARQEGEQAGNFEFVTPKVELLDPREGLIPVLPQDQKSLSQEDIVRAADRGEAAAAWKKQHWGTPRDVRLVDRLMNMPRLERLAKSPPRNFKGSANRNRKWFKGQGFQPATASTTKTHPVFWKSTDLFLSAKSRVSDLLLQKQQCSAIGSKYREEGLHRPRSPLLYKAPLLLINKGCTKFLFSYFDVLFQDDFQSICAPAAEEDELLFLAAVLNSPLTQYLLFHTTSNIGIERDIARLEEILELPFPLPKETSDPDKSAEIIRNCASIMRNLFAECQEKDNFLLTDYLVATANEKLSKMVYDYFDICDWERHLIQDSVEIFRPSSTPSSLDSPTLMTAHPSNSSQRESYADTLLATFAGWIRTNQGLWAESSVDVKTGLALMTLGVGESAKAYSESNVETSVAQLLKRLSNTGSEDGSVFARLKGFVLYEPDRVHILKPLNLRHWTRTAALNDADEILTQMMEESGWRD